MHLNEAKLEWCGSYAPTRKGLFMANEDEKTSQALGTQGTEYGGNFTVEAPKSSEDLGTRDQNSGYAGNISIQTEGSD